MATLVERVNNQKGPSASKVLDALLLDVSLLDFVWEPCRATGWLVDHCDRASENVYTLGATLS